MINNENPESRVSLIAINKEKQVLLKRSHDRWSDLLTVPGRKIELGKEGILTLINLLEEQRLNLIQGTEPEFLSPPYHAINPRQFSGNKKGLVHMIFHEYYCMVEGTPKTGEFFDHYKILNENNKYYKQGFIDNVDISLVVEEITYQTLIKYADHIFRNHT